jgi:hypothetical protein
MREMQTDTPQAPGSPQLVRGNPTTEPQAWESEAVGDFAKKVAMADFWCLAEKSIRPLLTVLETDENRSRRPRTVSCHRLAMSADINQRRRSARSAYRAANGMAQTTPTTPLRWSCAGCFSFFLERSSASRAHVV